MNENEAESRIETLRSVVLECLAEVAPDVNTDTLASDRPIRDQFEFDSMDRLNLAIALHERLGVDIPERDYRELASVDACVRYLEPRVAQ